MKQKIERLIHRAVEAGEDAGISVLIVKDGKELAYCEAGCADREAGIPVRRDTIFRLYSMTKPVTAAAAALLLERGELDLGQPVGDFIPSFKDQSVCGEDGALVPVRRPSTVRDLLNMTAGLVYLGDETEAERQTSRVYAQICAGLDTGKQITTQEMAERIGRCPLRFQPGARWQYSAGADILGAVIERVSGRRFETFLREELFEPLEMEDTGFSVAPEKAGRVAEVYQRNAQGGLSVYSGCHLGVMHDVTKKNAFESGGAGLVSTIDDYAKFAQMLLDGGSYKGRRLLNRRTVDFLTGGSLEAGQERGLKTWSSLVGYTYGNLMRVLKEPGQAVSLGSRGEYGWDGWLGCYFANCPAERLTILAMMQRTDSGIQPVVQKIRNIVFSSI